MESVESVEMTDVIVYMTPVISNRLTTAVKNVGKIEINKYIHLFLIPSIVMKANVGHAMHFVLIA